MKSKCSVTLSLTNIAIYKGHLKLILTHNVHRVKIQTLTERNQNKIQAMDIKYLRSNEEKTENGQNYRLKFLRSWNSKFVNRVRR